MIQSIEELAEKRRKWVEANRENGFEAGIKRLLTDLYPDNAHFIYELLQNAEDARAQEVRFILHEDRIEFEHDGRLFSIQDVNAITSIGFSTKRDDPTNIGKFGVGFKAVFAYTDLPEIESGGFNFRIRDMVVPEPYGFARRQSEHKQTRFVLPFNNSKKPSRQAYTEIETLLRALDATTLLFLTHIRKIEYLFHDSSLGYIEITRLGNNRFEILVQHPHERAPSSTWFMKFDKEVQVKDEEAENESQKAKSCRIAVAFGLTPVKAKAGVNEKKAGGADASPEWELAPMEPGRVCIYFPADKETSNLRFHLHAPFASTVARDSIRDCTGNNLLRDHLADLLAESMTAIRDQGLLTVHALAVLPNDRDSLPEFYQPLITRLVREFQEQDLVPMKRGGHAAASGIFRGSKALSDIINDDDMVTLLGDDYSPPMWAANPSLRNQREDNFLSKLDIEQWDTSELVKALGRLNKDALRHWMGGKDEKWHQDLYEMLIDFINAAPTAAEERKGTIKDLGLIRCSDGTYRKGGDCFFPTDGIQHDDKFPRVARGVYFADKEENKKAREFLETVGVREVDEEVEIRYILKERYSQEAVDKKQFRPELNDMERFIVFAEKHPGDIKLFQDHYIFKLESKKWGTSQSVYIDSPFMDTGLREWFEMQGGTKKKSALSDEYKTCGIKPEKISGFAEMLGVAMKMHIEKISISGEHPEWADLSRCGGKRSGYGRNEDYHIPGLTEFLVSPSVGKSRLVWRTMKELCSNYSCYLQAHYGRNASNIATAKSTLVHDLRTGKWVPQKNGQQIDFVQPRDAVAEKLPEDFEFQTGWQWLQALEFGEGVEKRREAEIREKHRRSQEYKRKEEVARDMGFESPEEAEEIARLKKENPEEFSKFKESVARNKRTTFPTRPVADPERHQERLVEQLSDAPDKKYEKRERSVRTTRNTIEPDLWLREQYTNNDGQMVCQICKKEMPFRKRDGEYYFEAVEAFFKDYFPVEHEAQFLALCPLCAAMYKELVKKDEATMTDLIEALLNMDSLEAPLQLGDLETSIRFVETHLHDMRTILGVSEIG